MTVGNMAALRATARRAIGNFAEPVVWTQDAAPHTTATFPAVCLFKQGENSAAGNPLGTLTADSWQVIISDEVGYAAQIAAGDTVKRVSPDAELLTVQAVTHREGRWHLTCTRDERAPAR